MSSPSSKVKSRGDHFAQQIETKITHEQAPAHNPYQVSQQIIHGYDHLDLLEHCNFIDVLFLLLRGELPTQAESKLFNKLAIALINPGPRHPAGQASIVTGVGKTETVHILPIALGVFGGSFEGAGKVEEAIRFFRRACRKPASESIDEALNNKIPTITQLYGDADCYADNLMQRLQPEANSGKVYTWLYQLQTEIYPKNYGVTKASIAAAILTDLGFQPRQSAPLMQLFAAPGLLAHGLEYTNKPVTAMLFESDELYIVEPRK